MPEETTSQQSTPTNKSADMERRAWVRFAGSFEASVRSTGGMKDAGWPAKVLDLSAGGVGLILKHRFAPGVSLTLELKNLRGTFCKTVAARVRYAKSISAHGTQAWHVGCAFQESLTEEELKNIRE